MTAPDPGPVHSFGLEWEGGLPDADELFGPAGDPATAVEQVRHELGIGVPRRRYREELPAVSGLRERLGIQD